METTYNIDLFAIIILLGAAQGLILGIVFLVKPGELSRKLLGGLMLAFSLLLADIFSGYTRLILNYIWANNLTEPVNFTLGPLFFLYFKSSVSRVTRYDWLHFVPALLFVPYVAMYALQPDDLKLADFYHSYRDPIAWTIPYEPTFNFDPLHIRSDINELTVMMLVLYWIGTLIFLSRYKDQPKLGAYRLMNWMFGIAVILVIAVKVYFQEDIGDYLIASYMSLTIYVTDFYVIRRAVKEELAPQYAKSSLSEERKKAIMQKIKSVMEEDTYFKNDMASLGELAEKVGASSHHVSQVINESMGKSFFELLANYRIGEAQRILNEDTGQKHTVEQVAVMVGYNSKSAFNKAFKKITGTTPADFRKPT